VQGAIVALLPCFGPAAAAASSLRSSHAIDALDVLVHLVQHARARSRPPVVFCWIGAVRPLSPGAASGEAVADIYVKSIDTVLSALSCCAKVDAPSEAERHRSQSETSARPHAGDLCVAQTVRDHADLRTFTLKARGQLGNDMVAGR